MKHKVQHIYTFLAWIAMLACSHAATVTWDNDSADNNWNTAINWSSNTVPVANDIVNISNGDTVTSPTGNIPANMTINLTGGSTLDRPDSVIRMNGATVNVASGSGLTGNGFWDLNNADITFEDGAIATMRNFELKGTNTLTFEMGATGFTTLTPQTFLNDANNPASPATLIADDTFNVDLANYTGGVGVFTLMDFTTDSEGMDNAAFQNATLNILNSGVYSANIQWNDATEAIELHITAVPEPSAAIVLSMASILLASYRSRKGSV